MGVDAVSVTIAPPIHRVDVELLTFVERYATNLIRWDVLAFFGRNPTARESVLEIARQLGRQPRALEKELNDLVYLGILRARSRETGVLYELSRIPSTRRMVVRMARQSCNS